MSQGSQVVEIYPDIARTQQVVTRYYVDPTYVSQPEGGQTVRLTFEEISNHTIVTTGRISEIASSATRTKEGNVSEVIALAIADKQNSSKLKYGLQDKIINTIDKKTFFNYYKDKLLKDS